MTTMYDVIEATFLSVAVLCFIILGAAKIYEWLTGKRPRWLDE